MKKNIKNILAVIIALVILSVLGGVIFVAYWSVNKLETKEKTIVTIPFYQPNWIEIPITVNQQKARAIFDTGSMGNVISKSQVKKYNVIPIPFYIPVNGKSFHQLGLIRSLKIGNFDFKNVWVVIMDFKNNESSLHCAESDFLIGMPLIKQLIWNFDFSKKSLTLSNYKNFNEKLFTNQINYNNNIAPKTTIKIKDKNYKLLIDFGHTATVSIKEENISKNSNKYQTKDNEDIFGSYLDKGGRSIESIVLGKDTLPNTVVEYAGKGHNIVGLGVFLNYQKIVINPFQKTIYFTKIRTNSRKKYYTGLGFNIRRENGSLLVSSVFQNSPADKIHLTVGDTIEAINNYSADSLCNFFDYCDFLKEKNRILSKDSVWIKLKNNDTTKLIIKGTYR